MTTIDGIGETNAAWVAAQLSDDDYDEFPAAPSLSDDATEWPATEHDGSGEIRDDEYDATSDDGDEDGQGWYGESDHDDPEVDDLDRDLVVDLDDDFTAEDGEQRPEPRKARRFDSKVAACFGGAVLVAVVAALVLSVMFYSSADTDSTVVQRASVADPGAAAPNPVAPSAVPDAPISDRPLPYNADAAGSCPVGSTSAQTMAGTDPRNAFICVRNGVDGQFIDVDLSKTYVITALSLTPGWIGQDASGAAQWSQHRVVTIVQYLFNDSERTMLTQDTKNVHGEAVMPVKRVLASKVRMLIRQTSRPPVDTPTNANAAPGGVIPDLATLPPPPIGAADPLLGGQSNSDPVDATFAISSLKIIGHEPL